MIDVADDLLLNLVKFWLGIIHSSPKLLTLLLKSAFTCLKANSFKALVRKFLIFILSIKKKKEYLKNLERQE